MSSTTTPEITLAAGELRATRAREWRKMWFRFRQSTLSLVGLAIVVTIVLAAIFAPAVAPFRSMPVCLSTLTAVCSRRRPETG